MRFIWLTAVKDIRVRLRDPVALLVWIGVPLFFAGLMSVIFGGGGAPIHGTLLFVDEDESFASEMLGRAFSSGRLGEMISVEEVGREAGRRRIDKGDGSALLIVPEGFAQALLRGEKTRVELSVNPAQRIVPGVIEQTLRILADGAFYIQQFFVEETRLWAEGPPEDEFVFDDERIAASSVRINNLFRNLSKYVDPPLIELETAMIEEEGGFGGGVNMGVLFFPGAFFMSLLFMAQSMGAEIWREREQHTLRRVLATPVSVTMFLAGKTLGFTGLAAIVASMALLLGSWMLAVDYAALSLPLAWITVFTAAFYLSVVYIQSFASSARVGGLLTGFALFPLLMTGGSFFPFEAMPPAMAAFGRLTPNGWALSLFREILAGEAESIVVAQGFLGLIAFLIAMFWIVGRRLRRVETGA